MISGRAAGRRPHLVRLLGATRAGIEGLTQAEASPARPSTAACRCARQAGHATSPPRSAAPDQPAHGVGGLRGDGLLAIHRGTGEQDLPARGSPHRTAPPAARRRRPHGGRDRRSATGGHCGEPEGRCTTRTDASPSTRGTSGRRATTRSAYPCSAPTVDERPTAAASRRSRARSCVVARGARHARTLPARVLGAHPDTTTSSSAADLSGRTSPTIRAIATRPVPVALDRADGAAASDARGDAAAGSTAARLARPGLPASAIGVRPSCQRPNAPERVDLARATRRRLIVDRDGPRSSHSGGRPARAVDSPADGGGRAPRSRLSS